MTRKLILHIGSHKTGTTSLQLALRQGQKDKTLGNYSYMHARPRVDFNPLIACEGMGANMHPVLRWPFLDRRIIDADERSFGDCIISTEMLFWIANPGQIVSLKQRLSQHFDEIHIIAYLRRQDAVALSHRKQVVLGRAAYQFYGAQERALPVWRPHMMRYFDYATKLANWEDVFGSENITVRRFQKRDLVAGDTVQDFYAWAGLPPPPQQEKQNISMSRSALMAGLWLRRLGYPRGAIMHAVEGLPEDGALLPDIFEIRAWLERFAEVNARLAARYDPAGPEGYFDVDLSAYPEQSNADQLAPEVLERLRALAEAFRLERDLPFDPLHPGDRA